MYALVVDGMIAVLAARPHHADNGDWHQVVDVPKPVDTLTSTFDQTIQVVDGLPNMVWVERFFTVDELTELRRGTNQVALLGKARTAINGNIAAVTSATDGTVAAMTAGEKVAWLIARDVAHERQLTALIRLIVGADLLDNVDGT